MMAAITAAEAGFSVLIIEKNRDCGKKLSITGKGRCNLTNDSSIGDVMNNIPTNGRFLYSSLSAFPPSETMDFFRSLGVELKTERGGRVFPASDKAQDVVDAMRKELSRRKVAVIHSQARGLLISDSSVMGVRTADADYICRKVLVATGGLSYPRTGSTGDGYEFARQAGHTVTECTGSLVPLESCDRECAMMQGLSLRNVAIDLRTDKGRSVYTDFGEMLFTHFGVSGPVILSASAHMCGNEGVPMRLFIDLKPALDEKKLDQRLLRDISEGKNRNYSTILSGLMHPLMIPVAIMRTGIPADTKVHSLTRQQRRSLLEFLKGFSISITAKRPVDEAVITSGGVNVAEINPSTMESKLIKGLYFAGEIIDTDAYTGGFNLQIAWSTGRAAGTAMRSR